MAIRRMHMCIERRCIMNKSEFMFPEIDIIFFASEDVITASGGVKLPEHNWD